MALRERVSEGMGVGVGVGVRASVKVRVRVRIRHGAHAFALAGGVRQVDSRETDCAGYSIGSESGGESGFIKMQAHTQH